MLSIPEYKDAEKVFKYFEEISKIPHGSENTKPIADYLVKFAVERKLEYYRDGADNVIIKKPATKGYENRPAVIFQGHTDMVADKKEGYQIDMEKEGLKLYRDGDFLRAEGTTLGGDDGVAVAYSLALLDSDGIEHPAFEAVFTSDEEIGLIGANALDTSRLSGSIMINIDSDIEGVFTVGCAGGMRIDVDFPVSFAKEKCSIYTLSISGLKGGHSGMEIDKGRVNGIKLLGKMLSGCKGVRISEISGGNADNAIPRYAECTFTAEEVSLPSYEGLEEGLTVELTKKNAEVGLLSEADSKRIIDFIMGAPSGVKSMSEDIAGLVETSSNLGIVKTEADKISVCISVRSAKDKAKRGLADEIHALGEGLSGIVSERGEYPAWEYRRDSHLRDIMCKVYRDAYGKDAEVITIHAGLECGIFAGKMKNFDCVSIGPTNYDIHTPEERLSISSVARVWEYLKLVLKEI